MAKFYVEKREVLVQLFEVEADDEDAACVLASKLDDVEAVEEFIDDSTLTAEKVEE